MPLVAHGILTPNALRLLRERIGSTDGTSRAFAVIGVPADALLALVDDLVETRAHLVRLMRQLDSADRDAVEIAAKQHLQTACTREQFDLLYTHTPTTHYAPSLAESEGGLHD